MHWVLRAQGACLFCKPGAQLLVVSFMTWKLGCWRVIERMRHPVCGASRLRANRFKRNQIILLHLNWRTVNAPYSKKNTPRKSRGNKDAVNLFIALYFPDDIIHMLELQRAYMTSFKGGCLRTLGWEGKAHILCWPPFAVVTICD